MLCRCSNPSLPVFLIYNRHPPLKGLFDVFLTSKGEKKLLFLPHPLHAMLCRCSSYLQKTTNTPTLNGGDRGGMWIFLFSQVTIFEDNVSTIIFWQRFVDKNLQPNDQFPGKGYPILDSNSLISIPYPRPNCFKTVSFTAAHTYLVHIWQ